MQSAVRSGGEQQDGSFGRCEGQSRRGARASIELDGSWFNLGTCVKPRDGVPDSNSCDGVSELRGKCKKLSREVLLTKVK